MSKFNLDKSVPRNYSSNTQNPLREFMRISEEMKTAGEGGMENDQINRAVGDMHSLVHDLGVYDEFTRLIEMWRELSGTGVEIMHPDSVVFDAIADRYQELLDFYNQWHSDPSHHES